MKLRRPLPRSTRPIAKQSQKQEARYGKQYSTIVKKSTKKIRAVNPEAEARRKATRRKKHGAYRRSETFKIVAARAGGQCEFTVTYHAGGTTQQDRCDETEKLEHHHRRYGRQFGGNERPEDMQVLCKTHHHWMESQHPTRKR